MGAIFILIVIRCCLAPALAYLPAEEVRLLHHSQSKKSLSFNVGETTLGSELNPKDTHQYLIRASLWQDVGGRGEKKLVEVAQGYLVALRPQDSWWYMEKVYQPHLIKKNAFFMLKSERLLWKGLRERTVFHREIYSPEPKKSDLEEISSNAKKLVHEQFRSESVSLDGQVKLEKNDFTHTKLKTLWKEPLAPEQLIREQEVQRLEVAMAQFIDQYNREKMQLTSSPKIPTARPSFFLQQEEKQLIRPTTRYREMYTRVQVSSDYLYSHERFSAEVTPEPASRSFNASEFILGGEYNLTHLLDQDHWALEGDVLIKNQRFSRPNQNLQERGFLLKLAVLYYFTKGKTLPQSERVWFPFLGLGARAGSLAITGVDQEQSYRYSSFPVSLGFKRKYKEAYFLTLMMEYSPARLISTQGANQSSESLPYQWRRDELHASFGLGYSF